jgi:hypothetical protein
MKHITRTDKQIHQLARDWVDGKIFGTWHGEDSEQAFPTLKNPEILTSLHQAEIFHVYQYIDRAVDKLNTMPIFTTFETLNRYDAARLDQAIHRLTRHKTT